MNQDNETAYAWAAILERLKKLREEGYTQQEIGDILEVSKAAISRWLSEEKGGERTTFGDMLRYAKRLGIPAGELTKESFFTTPFAIAELPPHRSTKQPKEGFKTISFDAPEWMIQRLDDKSRQLGINRQALIKVWLADNLAR